MAADQHQPTLTTSRLTLRPFDLSDAPAVQRQAGDRRVYQTTLRIPHPYKLADAESWLAGSARRYAEGQSIEFAATLTATGELVGCIGLEITPVHRHAELGYWIGPDHWSCGYATEAGRAILDFAFNTLGLHRVHVHHFAENTASARVIEKLGFQREGLARQHVYKDGQPIDIVLYGLLASQYMPQ
ncbi:GNAT family N-acetyltransferase [Planctomycetales bacterium ZRK34]|nr:GNAT family N-acetyltransferase [Planctomycetales bacterium ZRK34]